ncbi:MAG TPA: prepilin-type N-terminal cleavage/methylation domain-containing protein [Gemmatimonadales bacterium]|nr:prepilin-type N-terminal cleavage/methylation domain-containing protein [Gemmatimonadales bacterium]
MTPLSSGDKQSAGFTLIEIMMSITILAIGILALGTLMTRAARSAGAASALTYQTTVLAAEAARLDAVPFASLAAGTTCDTVTTPPLARIRCATVTDINPKLRQVSVVVTPTDNPLLQPDSIVFERSISGSVTPPLSTP